MHTIWWSTWNWKLLTIGFGVACANNNVEGVVVRGDWDVTVSVSLVDGGGGSLWNLVGLC